jgi:hypothetical protein
MNGSPWAFGWWGYSIVKEHGRFAANAKLAEENPRGVQKTRPLLYGVLGRGFARKWRKKRG